MKPFKFFKIIVSSPDQKMLRIPKSFNKNFKNRAAADVKLTVPTGVAWDIGIIKMNKEFYFEKGWTKFTKDNRISYGYFLEFEYLGNLLFNVHIFNLSCCEIDYPLNDHTYLTEEDDDDDNNGDDDDNGDEVEKQKEDDILSKASFIKEVRVCNVAGGHYMHIPKSFVEKYMRGYLRKSVKLQLRDGREWWVSCTKSRTGLRLQGPTWKKFAQENNWRIGDMYRFNIVKDDHDSLVLEVLEA